LEFPKEKKIRKNDVNDDYETIMSGKTATIKTKLMTTTKQSRTNNGRTMDDLFDTKIISIFSIGSEHN
jgi:hypothetical protein